MRNHRNDSHVRHSGAGAEHDSAARDDADTYHATLRNGKAADQIGAVGSDAGAPDFNRRWLNRLPTPERKRSPMDPSLYTWKGYRNWSDKIRRGWKQDE